jgi:hypothetical protein
MILTTGKAKRGRKGEEREMNESYDAAEPESTSRKKT